MKVFDKLNVGMDWERYFYKTFSIIALLIVHSSFSFATSTSVNPIEFQALSFEENQGQTASPVKFIVRQNHLIGFMTSDGILLKPTKGEDKPSRGIKLSFTGTDEHPEPKAGQRLPGVVNYMKGSQPRDWLIGVPTFSDVIYHSVYPGVDVRFYGRQDLLEYDFIIAPRARTNRIALSISGATQLSIDPSGTLLMQSGDLKLKQMPPVAYQHIDGQRRPVQAQYRLRNNTLKIVVGDYDKDHELIIDPLVVVYSTYLGGQGHDEGRGIAVDDDGNAYVTGQTNSLDFPTLNPLQAALAGDEGDADAFVSKFSEDGSLIYSTYLGGEDYDEASDIVLHSDGGVSITGVTTSESFPLVAPLQVNLAGIQDAFVSRLDATGSALIFSTYLGGNGAEFGHGIATDSDDDVYVTGFTTSENFPALNAVQNTYAGDYDAFVTKIEADGSALVYSTYLGGGGRECFIGIGDNIACRLTVDNMGSAIVAGYTQSDDFPTASPIQANNNSVGASALDGFVSKLSPDGSSFVFSTYLGGSHNDGIRNIAVDSADNIYVAGSSSSIDFPTTPGAFKTQLPSEDDIDGFVTKFNPQGTAYIYSTYLGGTGTEIVFGIDVTEANEAIVTGYTTSDDFPLLGALQDERADTDLFVTGFNENGNGIIFSTYFGGIGQDRVYDLATRTNLDDNIEVYLTGFTEGSSYPITNAFQSISAGGREAIVSKFEFERFEFPYEYTAKVVCGLQAERENMRLARGFYATTVNIHSPNQQNIFFFKKLALSYPPAEQVPGEIRPIATHELAYDEAIAVDCENLSNELYDGLLGQNDMPYIEGFVVVQSTDPLDITSVYSTAALNNQNEVAEHSSIHVEQIRQRFTGLDVEVIKSVNARICSQTDYDPQICWVLFEISITNNGPNHAHNLVVNDSLNGPILNQVGADLMGLPSGGPLFTIIPGIYLFSPVGIGAITGFDPNSVPQTFELTIPLLENGETASFQFWALGLGFSESHLLLSNDPPGVDNPNLLIDQVNIRVDEVDTNDGNDQFILEVEL